MIEGWGWKNDRTRFATLTIENTESADEGISRIMEAWHKTLATKTWGRLIAGGFRAVEVKPGKNGRWNVHLHAILYMWIPGIPYALLRGVWDRAAGGTYNQRFDELRNKAKPREGESKGSAAARYLVKYLVKHEELKGTRRMPGGLSHLLGAIEGRRLFGAWGLGAAAMRIERNERPRWTGGWDKHLMGYRKDGELPLSAQVQTPWGIREWISIPMPPLPAAFRAEDVPEQVEAKGSRWTIRKVNAGNPMSIHPWQRIPSASMRSMKGMRTMLEQWLDNPKSRGPKPFRWRAWYQDAGKEWTDDAGVIMGQRVRGNLGAALWDRVQKPDDRFPGVDHPEHVAHQLVAAYAQAVRTARRFMSDACTDQERVAYLSRLPDSIREHLEEICRESERVRWTYRPPIVEGQTAQTPENLCRSFLQPQKSFRRRGVSRLNGLKEPLSRRPGTSEGRTAGPCWIQAPLPLGPWT